MRARCGLWPGGYEVDNIHAGTALLKPGYIEYGVVWTDSAIVVCIHSSDTSAFVNPAGQLLLTRQGKTRMDGVGIVFEFYIAPSLKCYKHPTASLQLNNKRNTKYNITVT